MKVSTCLGLLASLAPAMAEINFVQQSSNLNFTLQTSTSGSNTDLHFNMSIPASNGWGGIGIGPGMVGALMFVLLPDKTNGSTISVRNAPAHVMPTPLAGVDYEVLGGSMNNGIMSAQAVCRSCQTWASGSLDPTSTSQGFIWAVGPGTSGVIGTGQNAMIMQHSIMGLFDVNLVQAALSPSEAGATGSGVSGGAIEIAPKPNLVIAHAVIFILAFLFFYPLGIVLLRLPGIGSWKIHAGVQTIATALVIAGLAIAVTMSRGTLFGSFNVPHQGVGLAAASIAIFQWLVGVVHHIGYRKFQSRWAVTYIHWVAGPVATVLGVINPILGFMLTEMRSAAIGIGVVGIFIWLVTFAFVWTLDVRSAKRPSGKADSDVRVVDMEQK